MSYPRNCSSLGEMSVIGSGSRRSASWRLIVGFLITTVRRRPQWVLPSTPLMVVENAGLQGGFLSVVLSTTRKSTYWTSLLSLSRLALLGSCTLAGLVLRGDIWVGLT